MLVKHTMTQMTAFTIPAIPIFEVSLTVGLPEIGVYYIVTCKRACKVTCKLFLRGKAQVHKT